MFKWTNYRKEKENAQKLKEYKTAEKAFNEKAEEGTKVIVELLKPKELTLTNEQIIGTFFGKAENLNKDVLGQFLGEK